METFLQADYATDSASAMAAAGIGIGIMIFGLLLFLFFGYCLYRIFQKAGVENAWMGFIPILGYLPMLQIAKKPTWWIILMLIPFVNFIIAVIIWMRICKAFGKSEVFGIAIIVVPFIILPLLAFDSSTYDGAAISDDTARSGSF